MGVRRTSSAGFTLLEMLAAMGLMVAVAACLYSSLHTSFRARRSADYAIAPTMAAWRAIELFKQDVLGALPPRGILAGEFVGYEDSIVLHTTYAHSVGEGLSQGISMVELAMEEDGESRRLVRRVTSNLLSPRAAAPVSQVLCRGVRSLKIRYFDGFAWQEEWDSSAYEDSLPSAIDVEIEVEYQQNGGGEARARRLMASFPMPCGVGRSQQAI